MAEWKDALERFDDRQRRIAVEAAQANGWFDRGVFGLESDERNYYALRFPLHHDDTIRREARRNRIDPAWVAAEIRAESIFNPQARSGADARGLMQVLPSTGAAVARRIGQPWGGGESLYDADFWIETITYAETRDYVARVLAFSVIYDWRLEGDALRLTDRMEGRVEGPRKQYACPAG